MVRINISKVHRKNILSKNWREWGYNPPSGTLTQDTVGVTCTKNTRNTREDTRKHTPVHEEYAYHPQRRCVTYPKNTCSILEEYGYHTQGLCVTYCKEYAIYHTQG